MTQEEVKLIQKILGAVEKQQPVPIFEVREWLRSGALDVLGVVNDLILEHPDIIQPRLTLQESCDAVRAYYKRCLAEDRESEFVPSFHIAGYELVQWFRNLWNDTSVPRQYLSDLKNMLGELYKSSDDNKADRIVNAVIEHLFETPAIVDFFLDWKNDPALRRGYARALEWMEKPPS